MAGILVLNVRGTLNIPHPVRRTLELLNLRRRHRATIVPDTPEYLGMLKRAKDYIAWYPITPELATKLLKLRGRAVGNRPITEDDLKRLGFKDFKELGKALADGRVQLNRLDGIKPSFALNSPRGGYKKPIQRPYGKGGVLGENPMLLKLVEAML